MSPPPPPDSGSAVERTTLCAQVLISSPDFVLLHSAVHGEWVGEWLGGWLMVELWEGTCR